MESRFEQNKSKWKKKKRQLPKAKKLRKCRGVVSSLQRKYYMDSSTFYIKESYLEFDQVLTTLENFP
jgi:hypothetical protein